MDKDILKAGNIFKANRNDIYEEHEKYQLYFADDLILLINSKPNKRTTVNVKITPSDCPILEHDSHICLDDVFCYLDNFKVLKISTLSERALRELKEKIVMSWTIPQYKIDKIRDIIDECLTNSVRQNFI